METLREMVRTKYQPIPWTNGQTDRQTERRNGVNNTPRAIAPGVKSRIDFSGASDYLVKIYDLSIDVSRVYRLLVLKFRLVKLVRYQLGTEEKNNKTV